jgi:hypothetical protein
MAHDALVVVQTFSYRFEADLAKSALDAAEIDAMVRSDDAGGLRPAMSMTNGVELLVRREDLARASEILKGTG